jgi:aryl sulfotransferase
MNERPQPTRNRVYRNHMLDSRRWDRVRLRPDDIIISTSYKAGTTWTQRIVSLLLFGPEAPMTTLELSPWIDARFVPIPLDDLAAAVEAQTHRRFMKSHLPLDALPWDARVRYVYVGRDGRDVFMSWANHWAAFSDFAYELLNSGPDFVGEPLARCPSDIHRMFDDWIHRASFPWEQDGYPTWSHFYHAQSFWKFRHLPNIHFLHYSDLKEDLVEEMRRLAEFLAIPVEEANWPTIAEAASFDTMKRDAVAAGVLADIFDGGANRFFFKGTNGRWKDVLTPHELAEYDKAVARSLTPDCAAWLERGRVALDPPPK